MNVHTLTIGHLLQDNLSNSVNQVCQSKLAMALYSSFNFFLLLG